MRQKKDTYSYYSYDKILISKKRKIVKNILNRKVFVAELFAAATLVF